MYSQHRVLMPAHHPRVSQQRSSIHFIILHLFIIVVLLAFVVDTVTAQSCTPLNQRCQGAPGFPLVPWLGCCQGTCVEDQALGWGKFCKLTGEQLPTSGPSTVTQASRTTAPNSAATCTPINQRCQGAPGFPFVVWRGCCQGSCVEDRTLGWGKFCKLPGQQTTSTTVPQTTTVQTTKTACTPLNERCQGAPGFALVPWLGCCAGTCIEDAAKGWGKFCIANGGSTAGSGSTPATVGSTQQTSSVTSRSPTTVSANAAPPATAVSPTFERDPDATGNNFYGLTFSPFGLGDNRVCAPFDDTGGFCLLSDQVAKDLAIIRSMTRRIKSYSINACYNSTLQMLQFAKDNGMRVMLGVWIMNDPAADDREMASLTPVISQYSDVISEIVIGNEAIFTEHASNLYLISRLKEAKDIVKKAEKSIPVGTAEVWGIWMRQDSGRGLPEDPAALVEASDFIGLNTHPWWTGVDPNDGNAGTHVSDSHYVVSNTYKKRVIITETGYPSAGPPHNGADTGLDRLERAMHDIEAESRAKNIPVYYFEPFDGDWKRRWQKSTLEIDYNFGIRKCDRSRKEIRIPLGGAL